MIIANWKTTLNRNSLINYCSRFEELQKAVDSVAFDVVIAPSALHLWHVQKHMPASIKLAAQDCSCYQGALHTGEVTASMLAESGCSYVLLAHSERKSIERTAMIRNKLHNIQAAGMQPIYCIGENFSQKQSQQTALVLHQQLMKLGIKHLQDSQAIIAYEPLWAIGSGLTPTLDEIAQVALSIKNILPGHRVIYGGSVYQGNAPAIYSIDGIDGVLVGSASTDIDHFLALINTISNIHKNPPIVF